MQERHIQRPAKISETFHWRLTDVPYQAVTLRKVLGVAHGDHGVVNKGKVTLFFDNEGGANNKGKIKNRCDNQEQVEKFAFSFHQCEYIICFVPSNTRTCMQVSLGTKIILPAGQGLQFLREVFQ